jgi:DUSP domain
MSDVVSDHAIAMELARQLQLADEESPTHHQPSSFQEPQPAHLTDFYAATRLDEDLPNAGDDSAESVLTEMGIIVSGSSSKHTSSPPDGEFTDLPDDAHTPAQVGVDEEWYRTAQGEIREASKDGKEVDKKEQCATVRALTQAIEMQEHDHWYLVHQQWFAQWAEYVGYYDAPQPSPSASPNSYAYGEDVYYTPSSYDTTGDGGESGVQGSQAQLETVFRARPPPVDNLPLLEEESMLCRKHLREDDDYVAVCEQVWLLFMVCVRERERGRERERERERDGESGRWVNANVCMRC